MYLGKQQLRQVFFVCLFKKDDAAAVEDELWLTESGTGFISFVHFSWCARPSIPSLVSGCLELKLGSARKCETINSRLQYD